MQDHRTEETNTPIAYSVDGARKKLGFGRSKLFEEMNAGRLKAKKAGRRTLILHEDLVAWAVALPERQIEKRAA